jgi:hypothetical protein
LRHSDTENHAIQTGAKSLQSLVTYDKAHSPSSHLEAARISENDDAAAGFFLV